VGAIVARALQERDAVLIYIKKRGSDEIRAEQLLLDPSRLAAPEEFHPPPVGFPIQQFHLIAFVKLAGNIPSVPGVIPEISEFRGDVERTLRKLNLGFGAGPGQAQEQDDRN
jgi:hypothetical protein